MALCSESPFATRGRAHIHPFLPEPSTEPPLGARPRRPGTLRCSEEQQLSADQWGGRLQCRHSTVRGRDGDRTSQSLTATRARETTVLTHRSGLPALKLFQGCGLQPQPGQTPTNLVLDEQLLLAGPCWRSEQRRLSPETVHAQTGWTWHQMPGRGDAFSCGVQTQPPPRSKLPALLASPEACPLLQNPREAAGVSPTGPSRPLSPAPS